MAQQSLIEPALPSTQTTIPTATNNGSLDSSSHPVRKTLASAANLANLLPTGTVLAFQALIPSFANNGTCHLSNKYLTLSLISSCALTCFLSSFTDSFTSQVDGKLYYGIATFKGFYIFNIDYGHDKKDDHEVERKEFFKYRLGFIDFVHAFLSFFVFLTFSFSNSFVQDCFSPGEGSNGKQLVMNLPLGVGVLASLLFTLFPTTRQGIGYADTAMTS